MNTIQNRKVTIGNFRAFTLVELLVVISIMAILAGFTIPVLTAAKRQQYIKAASAEMQQIETALENYKIKYGAYPPGNQNAATASYFPVMMSQLYYELAGTINNGASYVTLDGSSQILVGAVKTAYGVGGFVNCSRGSGEDVASAKNFLLGLKQNQFNTFVTNNNVQTAMIVTSVGGPDNNYHPLDHVHNPPTDGPNPFRYLYPGTNNPNSYDLWVQLVIRGKTNLVCNWSQQVQINNPLP